MKTRMGRVVTAVGLSALAVWACSPQKPVVTKPVEVPIEEKPDAGRAEETPKACAGDSIDLMNALVQPDCEVDEKSLPNEAIPLNDKLEIAVSAEPAKVKSGDALPLKVVFTNTTDKPLVLFFALDPTPRFVVEATDKRGKRVDTPTGTPPRLPKGTREAQATTMGLSRVEIAPKGKAEMTVEWKAVQMRWAPELLHGELPATGYPRAPGRGLPRGKYSLKVITPLTAVEEGEDRKDVSATVDVEVTR